MELFGQLVIVALLVIGGCFSLIAAYAMIKLPDPMCRLHGPTKATTLGVGSVLLASLAWFFWFSSDPSWHELLIALFLFLTAPLSGLMLSKVNMHLLWRKEDIPAPGPSETWATYAAPDKPSVMDTPEIEILGPEELRHETPQR